MGQLASPAIATPVTNFPYLGLPWPRPDSWQRNGENWRELSRVLVQYLQTPGPNSFVWGSTAIVNIVAANIPINYVYNQPGGIQQGLDLIIDNSVAPFSFLTFKHNGLYIFSWEIWTGNVFGVNPNTAGVLSNNAISTLLGPATLLSGFLNPAHSFQFFVPNFAGASNTAFYDSHILTTPPFYAYKNDKIRFQVNGISPAIADNNITVQSFLSAARIG